MNHLVTIFFVFFASSAHALDLGRELQTFQNKLESQNWNARNCSNVLNDISSDLLEMRSTDLDPRQALQQGRGWIEAMFRLRLSVRARLVEFSKNNSTKDLKACANSVRRISRSLRSIEDSLILWVLKPKDFDAGKDPVAGPTLQGTDPQLQRKDATSTLQLRSGDVMLSRGNAGVSGAIARISEEEAQFSHTAQVYIDAPVGTLISVENAIKDPRVKVIEAHIEVGSIARTFKDYVNDGNGRVLLFRPNLDATRAHQAAKSILAAVEKYQRDSMLADGRTEMNVNDNIPYDFKMDLQTPNQLFCSEVVAMAYRKIGVTLPTFASAIKSNSLTQRMGIQVTSTFAPSDVELDPQFDLIAEWRDVRKLSSIIKKDSALAAMYRWMDERNYRFHTMAPEWAAAWFAWKVRQMDLGFQARMPKHISRDLIHLVFSLERTSGILESHLSRFHSDSQNETRGLKPFFIEDQEELEEYRRYDEYMYREGYRNEFHTSFNWREY